MKQGHLYIIRHGRTDWNDRHKLQGRTDIPLNDEGRRMASAAAEEYADIAFDVCFCSPLCRAKETAEILLKGRNVPVYYDERLMEMAFGAYEGIEDSFKIPDCPVNQFFFHPEDYREPAGGGESTYDLMARTGGFLEEVAYPLLAQGKSILIVGHGAMNMSIVVQVRKLPVEDFWKTGIKNCKLIQLL